MICPNLVKLSAWFLKKSPFVIPQNLYIKYAFTNVEVTIFISPPINSVSGSTFIDVAVILLFLISFIFLSNSDKFKKGISIISLPFDNILIFRFIFKFFKL